MKRPLPKKLSEKKSIKKIIKDLLESKPLTKSQRQKLKQKKEQRKQKLRQKKRREKEKKKEAQGKRVAKKRQGALKLKEKRLQQKLLAKIKRQKLRQKKLLEKEQQKKAQKRKAATLKARKTKLKKKRLQQKKLRQNQREIQRSLKKARRKKWFTFKIISKKDKEKTLVQPSSSSSPQVQLRPLPQPLINKLSKKTTLNLDLLKTKAQRTALSAEEQGQLIAWVWGDKTTSPVYPGDGRALNWALGTSAVPKTAPQQPYFPHKPAFKWALGLDQPVKTPDYSQTINLVLGAGRKLKGQEFPDCSQALNWAFSPQKKRFNLFGFDKIRSFLAREKRQKQLTDKEIKDKFNNKITNQKTKLTEVSCPEQQQKPATIKEDFKALRFHGFKVKTNKNPPLINFEIKTGSKSLDLIKPIRKSTLADDIEKLRRYGFKTRVK